jgi:hypothetical protein
MQIKLKMYVSVKFLFGTTFSVYRWLRQIFTDRCSCTILYNANVYRSFDVLKQIKASCALTVVGQLARSPGTDSLPLYIVPTADNWPTTTSSNTASSNQARCVFGWTVLILAATLSSLAAMSYLSSLSSWPMDDPTRLTVLRSCSRQLTLLCCRWNHCQIPMVKFCWLADYGLGAADQRSKCYQVYDAAYRVEQRHYNMYNIR